MGLGTDSVSFLHKRSFSSNPLVRRLQNIIYWRIKVPKWNKQFENSVVKALRMGYRLIDTSASYCNEREIGNAIRRSGIPRNDIFVTTRVTNKQQYSRNVREAFFDSLNKLGLDYVDLYMIHWPVTGYYLDTWKEMEKLYKEGYIKNLGVANCHKHHLESILNICEIRPVVNQIEIHPLFSQKELIKYCNSVGIQVEAYSPIAQNDDRMIKNRALNSIAHKYKKNIQQIIIRWHIDNGVVPVPRSSNEKRLHGNLDVFDFSLTKEEIEVIDSININSRKRYDPDNCDFTQL